MYQHLSQWHTILFNKFAHTCLSCLQIIPSRANVGQTILKRVLQPPTEERLVLCTASAPTERSSAYDCSLSTYCGLFFKTINTVSACLV
uniref:Uncharacterized protein n=1 Tax=Trichuris muris TaxID=70415 RepID=A0A5S6Q8F2_TRIMR